MTYKELKVQVSKNTGLDEETISKVVDEVFLSIKNALLTDGRIQIPMFGVFHTKTKKPRQIKTFKGEIKKLPAKKVPAFTPSRALKQEIENHTFKEVNKNDISN